MDRKRLSVAVLGKSEKPNNRADADNAVVIQKTHGKTLQD